MRISEIEMQGLISGKCIPGDMKVNESLPVYLVRKFSDLHLQQEATEALMLAMRDDSRKSRLKLELLTAENAAMKAVFGPGEAVMNFLTIALRHTTYDEIDLNDVALAFKLSLPDVPATDAMVNEIRAEGVEMAINHLMHKFEGTGHIGVPVMALESLASQLRADAAKDGE